MKNILGKILGFGRMQQNIFFLFENVLKFFLKIFRRKPGILILDLYFTM
jgi:ABC-type amino acid transport system permease subunit